MTQQQKEILDRVEIKFVRTLDPRLTQATKTSTGYRVELSLGTLLLTDWVNQAKALEDTFPLESPVYFDYLKFLSEHMPGFIERLASGKDLEKAEVLPLFAISDIPDEQLKIVANSKEYNTNLVAYDSMSLAFILSHELAHIALGHLDHAIPSDPKELRNLEYEADTWGRQLTVKAGFDPKVVYGYFLLLLQYETQFLPQEASHELAACRAIRIMLKADEEAMANPNMVPWDGKPLDRADVISVIKKYKSLSKDMIDCNVDEAPR